MDGIVVPAALSALITAPEAIDLARTYDDRVIFPETLLVDHPETSQRLFPGWPSAVLVIAIENQGVCSWGVPLGDPDPAPVVLVGGEVGGVSGTVVFAPDVASYATARRWDGRCLSREPLLQAQAAPLMQDAVEYLRTAFDERPSTHGWPGHTQLRFERDGVSVLLWSDADQCDWWLSAADGETLVAAAEQLLDFSDLRAALWSNDQAGELLLQRLRAKR